MSDASSTRALSLVLLAALVGLTTFPDVTFSQESARAPKQQGYIDAPVLKARFEMHFIGDVYQAGVK